MSVLCHGFPPTGRVGINQYSTDDRTADFMSANGILSGGEHASGRNLCCYRDGGKNDTHFLHQRLVLCSRVLLAQPCSLALQRGGVGCEELNRQGFTLQRGVKRRGDVQLRMIKLHIIVYKKCDNFGKSIFFFTFNKHLFRLFSFSNHLLYIIQTG